MHTRIREHRKRQGLTLQELAEKTGTTAQTVQRLETANMTVSMEWLKKFSDALGVRIADLISDEQDGGIAMIGRMRRAGLDRHNAPADGTPERIALSVAADNPVAVQLDEDIGPYRRGAILIGNRLQGADLINAHGHDCIVATADGHVSLRRVVLRGDGATLVPLNTGEDVRFDVTICWAARLIMSVSYF